MARKSADEILLDTEQKIKMLQEKKARLEASKKEKERKARTSALIQLGALMEVVGLSWKTVDRMAVLGSFAKLAQAYAKPAELDELIKLGEKVVKERESND